MSLVIRASPQPGAPEAGKIFGKGSIVVATAVQGDYIRCTLGYECASHVQSFPCTTVLLYEYMLEYDHDYVAPVQSGRCLPPGYNNSLTLHVFFFAGFSQVQL